jgi:hypothetical protein
MGDITYSDDDPTMDTPVKTNLYAQTPFQERVLAIYGRKQFPGAATKKACKQIEKRIEKETIKPEYVEFVIGWVEKKNMNGAYIRIETLLFMLLSKIRQDEWLAKKGVVPEPPKPTTYGI